MRFPVRRAAVGPLLGLVIGACIAFFGFGPDYVLGTSSFWTYPPTDFSSHIIGWREYIQEPWGLPLLVSKKLEQPSGLAIYLMDCLPLVAFFAKMVRGLVPSWLETLYMNPLGWWQVVSYSLQGLFGALVMKRLGHRALAPQIGGAVVVLSMEAFIARFIHTALNSHFFVLASLWLYLGDDRAPDQRSSRAREAWPWALLLATCLLTHAYLFVMCAAFFAAAIVRRLVRRDLLSAALAAVTTTAAIYLALGFGGFFGEPLSHGGLWGFGHKSTDLLSFFVPQYSPFFPSRAHGMAIDLTRDELAEGYDYLGAGLLVLVPVTAIAAPRAIGSAIKRHVVLLVALVLMALFAISNRVSLGQHVIFEVPLPGAFEWFFRQLRSSGRFIWPITYTGALYVTSLAYRRFSSGRLALLPPLLVFVQLLDGMGNFLFVRSYTARSEARYLDWSAMRPVVEAHRGVSFGPTYQCVLWDHPVIARREMEIEWMAAVRGVGLGSVRTSRPLVDCARDAQTRLLEPIVPERLYVELAPEISPVEAVHFELRGAPCATFRGGYACSSRFAGGPPAGFGPMPPLEVDYTFGARLDIGAATAEKNLGAGWSFAETTHRWALGPISALYMRFDRPVPPDAKLVIHAGGALPHRPRLSVDVLVDEARAGTLEIVTLEAAEFVLPFPAAAAKEGLHELQLRTNDYRVPKEIGDGGDERPLGASVVDLAIVP